MLAATVLQANLDLLTYVPKVLQTWHGQRRLALLFPGYFFQANGMGGGATSAINRSSGLLRVVPFGVKLQPLAPKVVSTLGAAVERMNVGGLAQHKLRMGDIAWLSVGPPAKMDAVFVGPMTPAAGVQVLLDFFDSQRTLSVAAEELEQVVVQQGHRAAHSWCGAQCKVSCSIDAQPKSGAQVAQRTVEQDSGTATDKHGTCQRGALFLAGHAVSAPRKDPELGSSDHTACLAGGYMKRTPPLRRATQGNRGSSMTYCHWMEIDPISVDYQTCCL